MSRSVERGAGSVEHAKLGDSVLIQLTWQLLQQSQQPPRPS
jgi:hypothetical protein